MIDLTEYVPTRVDEHHTKLVHWPCGRETYVNHDSPSDTTPGASIEALTAAAEQHARLCG